MTITRRQFLSWGGKTCGVALLAGNLSAGPVLAKGIDWRQQLLDRDRWLSLERASTGEKAQFRYYKYGVGFEREGYRIACHLLRDVKSGVTAQLSPKLIDLIYLIQGWLRLHDLPFHIIILSGYRTPQHNATLKNSAKQSEHVNGNAADIRIPGIGVQALDKLAKAIGVGGVGVYPDSGSGFIHVDVGRVRSWRG